MVAMASCSQDEVLTPSAEVQDIRIVVGNFPAFDDAQTRAIGTFDSGKTAWALNDVIYIVAANAGVDSQILTLTYGTDGKWAADGTTIHYLSATDTHIRAIYAPNCEKEGTEIKAIDDLPFGTGEFLEKECFVVDGTLTVDFTNYERPYSRLRIVTEPNEQIAVTATMFNPAGYKDSDTYNYTLTADANGNAYLYGTFATGGTVTVKDKDANVLEDYSFTASTVPGNSYVLDVIGYSYNEQTNTYTVWSAKGLSVWGSAARANPSTNLFLTNDITLPTVGDGESNWERIGSGSKTYNGTIDGNYHTISGLRMNNPTNSWISFAGYADTQSKIMNLTFADAHISGLMYVGVVAGISKGTITNCHVTSGTITATNGIVGGIVGCAYGCTVTGCTNAASVSGDRNVGGIVGNTDSTPIVAACCNIGTVNSSEGSVGGIMGYLGNGTVIGCWTVDTDEKDQNSAVLTGKNGFGQENVTPNNCYSGDDATINGKVEDMNTALGTTYGYQWQVGPDSYPTLVKITE